MPRLVTALVAVVAVVALAVVLTRPTGTSNNAGGEVFLQPVAASGPDPFTDSVAVKEAPPPQSPTPESRPPSPQGTGTSWPRCSSEPAAWPTYLTGTRERGVCPWPRPGRGQATASVATRPSPRCAVFLWQLSGSSETRAGPAATYFALIAASIGCGLFRRSRQHLIALVRERAELAEADAESRAERARMEAREAIAREMHDVLGHRLSLLSVHAGALEFNPGAPGRRSSGPPVSCGRAPTWHCTTCAR
ncbi:hypothetical protein SAVIM40S_05193 [Streptomyces avidinii]